MTKPPSRPNRSLRWVLLFLGLAALLAGLQVWNAISLNRVVQTAASNADPSLPEAQLSREKTRQELIGKQIENEARGAVPITLSTGLSAAIAALATILGAVLALRGYLDAREKEHLDRVEAQQKELSARDKERKDRLNASLNETLTRLVSTEWRQRVVGAAGLLPFFGEDNTDFHLQAFTALIAAARIDDDQQAVRQGVRLAMERAVRSVRPSILREVSWQGAKLRHADLSGANLAGVDLRDAVLENACLIGADLSRADLTNAKLQGADLTRANLTGARLIYTDLAGAVLAKASLQRVEWTHAKVLSLELEGADLREPGPGWRQVPWDAARNWRKATLSPEMSKELDRLYGPEVAGMRILMLMWEMPPMVAGGTWTACYHLVRNLRRRGADVTVVVPWQRERLILDPPPFGVDVPIVTLEIGVDEQQPGQGSGSPYGGGAPAWSPYSGGAPSWSPYGQARRAAGPYHGGGPYGSSYGPYRGGSLAGSMLFQLINAFADRLAASIGDFRADLIHAHDWVTFDAARAAAGKAGIPWIAHFHSTESERQSTYADPLTARIEQSAVDTADLAVAVSEVSRTGIRAAYDPQALRRIEVIPNSFSGDAIAAANVGRFETHRVVFLGRLAHQKGVDRLCDVAEAVWRTGFSADFLAYGEGPDGQALWSRGIRYQGALDWQDRDEAFRGASALLVPSRAEPFGMVVLEAMQHLVPVIYPETSGAAEVLTSGVKVDAGDTGAMADAVMRLLGDRSVWERAAGEAAEEIKAYQNRRYEDRLIALWTERIARRQQAGAAH